VEQQFSRVLNESILSEQLKQLLRLSSVETLGLRKLEKLHQSMVHQVAADFCFSKLQLAIRDYAGGLEGNAELCNFKA
jgi:hypothetical protein